MERVKDYSRVVRQIMEAHARPAVSFPAECVEKLLIMDEERGHYQLLKLGWQDQKRIKWMMIYIRIKDGKILIEHDLTEDSVAIELVQAGVPKEDIVLSFQAPEVRQHLEYAAA
ncbi:MAG: XisI protein [Acidobacteria bacterium]|nr:XisI protein [Acidobacteriota bacterium]